MNVEKRVRDLTKPPVFGALEFGQAFFFKDRIFVKTSFTIAREMGPGTETRFEEYEEVQW